MSEPLEPSPSPRVVAVESPLSSPAHVRQSSDDEWEDVSNDSVQISEAAETKSPVASSPARDASKAVDLDPGWVAITEDGQVAKLVLQEGAGEAPPPLARVYIALKGKTPDGKYFVDTKHEEMDFIVGHATVARGLEMVIVGMKPGETAGVRVGPDYGYSAYRRPAEVNEGQPLEFQVTLVRFEKEKNLNEMKKEEKFEYAKQRRVIGNALFEQLKYTSASRQYEKALTVLDQMNDQLTSEEQSEKASLQTLFLVNTATTKLKSNEYAEVVTLASKALDLSAGNLKALWLRARALHARGQLEEAKRDYQALIDSPQADPQAKAASVKCLQALAKEQSALAQKQQKAFGGVFSNKKGRNVRLYDDKDEMEAEKPSFFSWLQAITYASVQWCTRRCRRARAKNVSKKA